MKRACVRPGKRSLVMSPFEPCVGLPMNVTSFAASRKRHQCSAWLAARSSIRATTLPVYSGFALTSMRWYEWSVS